MNSGPGPAPGTAQAHGPAHEAPARRHALPGRDAPEPVAALGEGAPLPGAVRSRMEAVVGGDLSDVRVHTGASAGEHTSREGALATTWGRHLAFAAGVYRPGTPVGEAVLAHELAHARQQEGSGQGVAGGALEGEADRAGYLAVLQLLDPGFTARAAPLTLSTGQGLQLQRCTAPHYGEIRQLPSREEYEQRGELSPKGFPELADLPQGTFVLDLSPRPPSRPAPAPPDAEEAEHDAPPLEYEQLVDRLNILEARQRQIDELITDVDPGLRPLSGSALMRSLSGGTIGMARLGLSRPGMPAREPLILVMPGYSLPTPEQTVPRDPVELSRKVAGADVVQRRVLEMLPQLKIARENEVAANSELEGYELVAALQAIDEVRRDYRDAADRVLTAQAPSALKRADERNAALKDILTRYKLDYYAHRSASGPEIQPSVNRINEWATTLQGDLADLDRQAAALQEARKRRDPKLPSLERAFSHDAEMVATSIEALGEWDSAVRAYEFLSKNTALWGQKGVEKIAARLEQMRQAASDRDLPYLQLLLRDHRADTAVKEFYAALPQIVAWSHLIIGLVITLLVAIVTAGVGIAISAAGTAVATAVAAAGTAEAASAATVVLNATFWVKLGGEAFIFTFLSRQLNATIPGMEPKSPFWVEFIWNLGMFGVMHGASAVAKSLIGTYALTSAVAKFAVNTAAQFVALEAFGYFRFAVEEQRTMTVGEFGQMSAQNVIMMAAMTATMKPMEPVLKGLEGELTSSFGRFARRYGAQSADLATRRAALETAVKQRMESRPTAGMDDVADLTKDAADLDADLHRLVDDVRADPTIDVRRMADELSGVMEKTAATTVLELLTGLDPAVDLQPTGDPTSWSFASGKGGQLAAFLRDGGYPVLTERSGGGVPAVIEAEIPGKGRVTFVERPADAPATPPAAPEAAAPPAATPAATAPAAVPAGDAPGPVPGSAAVPARVRRLIDLSAKLAKVRVATAAERAAAEPAGQAGVDPASPGAQAAEASAVDATEIAHRQAIDVAMQDARAEAGLHRLAETFQSSRNGLSRVLGSVPPENMGSFLRAAADPAFGRQEVSFFQALGRNAAACRLVEKYGGRVLLDLLPLQRGGTQAIRMTQARADVDRVLAGLEKASGQPGRTPGTTAVEDLLAGIRRARRYTYRTLDKLVDPRPELQVRIEPDLDDPQWPTYERRAAEYARRYPPEGKPLSVQERQLRAALFQTVERAWAGEYGDLSPAERAQMLELFDAVADATRLEDGWRSSKRGELNEALQLGTGRLGRPTAWVKGKLVALGTDGSSELDHADPPVTDAELRDGSVLTRKRTWIERKDYNINSSDQAMAVARAHYNKAVRDLGNLPPGSTIAVEYARDYAHLGDPTLRAMADLLYRDPRIVRVSFAGKVIPRR